jgi:NAD(P)-dependent dehydrogenase (short-subunit alcohol dehydrogenase family)
MEIEKSVILITGSVKRVGKSIALSLAERGAQIILHYNTSEEEARKTADELAAIGKKPLVVQGDVSQYSHWIRIKEQVLASFGRIDALINNAAVFYRTPLFETTEEQWDHFMAVNVKGIFLGSKLFGELMYNQKQGKIINISDISAEKAWSGYIPYSVSKAGVNALTRGLAKALAPYVTVNAVAPGTVSLTQSQKEENEQVLTEKALLKRIGEPSDIAHTVAFLLEGSDYITGTIITVDGGRMVL